MINRSLFASLSLASRPNCGFDLGLPFEPIQPYQHPVAGDTKTEPSPLFKIQAVLDAPRLRTLRLAEVDCGTCSLSQGRFVVTALLASA